MGASEYLDHGGRRSQGGQIERTRLLKRYLFQAYGDEEEGEEVGKVDELKSAVQQCEGCSQMELNKYAAAMYRYHRSYNIIRDLCNNIAISEVSADARTN